MHPSKAIFPLSFLSHWCKGPASCFQLCSPRCWASANSMNKANMVQTQNSEYITLPALPFLIVWNSYCICLDLVKKNVNIPPRDVIEVTLLRYSLCSMRAEGIFGILLWQIDNKRDFSQVKQSTMLTQKLLSICMHKPLLISFSFIW